MSAAWWRWLRILLASRTGEGLRVSYGHPEIPGPDDVVHGGMVKFQRLALELPPTGPNFNVLYLGSNTLPPDASMLIRLAHARGAKVAWNQNGVAYPGWHGPGWERVNARMKAGIHRADYVFFQSEFCRISSDRYLGPREGAFEVLHNSVDTTVFTPAANPGGDEIVLLLGGNQYQAYRLERAIQTLAAVVANGRNARLVVTGRLSWLPDEAEAARVALSLARSLRVEDRLELVGTYSQRDAPAVLRRGTILLHTKYNDPCPSLVVEAMACGLPVVYSASGGVPELVGEEGGVGVSAPLDWEQDHPPDPAELAAAVDVVAARLDDYREAARRRAVERFDLALWRDRHREVFESLVS